MKVSAIAAYNYNKNLPKKELTVNGCCDKINIISKQTVVKFGVHKFKVTITHCEHCGSIKATSNIMEYKNV